MALNLRSHSLNTYAYCKLMYRCNTINLRIGDIKVFKKTAKSFLYMDLLEKPDELTLYRDIEDGGLGLTNIQIRAKAALISTFLQTAINPKFCRNFYHNYLFRHFNMEENFQKPDIPPNFAGDFFPTIRRLKDSNVTVEDCSLKDIYNFLMTDVLRTDRPRQDPLDPNHNNNDQSESPLAPLKCEINSPTTDWKKTWRLVRSKGLGPELTSFTLKILWGIVPTRARLHKILPLAYQTPYCQLCETAQTRTPETLDHALFNCEADPILTHMYYICIIYVSYMYHI